MVEDYQKKSVITVAVVLLMMGSIGFLVNYFQPGTSSTTGAVTAEPACYQNSECDDGIACTIDSCKNPGESIAFCDNRPVDYCRSGDGCCPAGCKPASDNDCS